MLNLFLQGLSDVRRRNQIATPGVVEEVTREWHIENDKVRIHIGERCELNPKEHVFATDLYNDFKLWCRHAGVKPYGITQWGKRMAALKYRKTKQNGLMVYYGLKLKPVPTTTNVTISTARLSQN